MNNYLTTSINYFNTPSSPVLYTDKIKSSNTPKWKFLNTQPNPQYIIQKILVFTVTYLKWTTHDKVNYTVTSHTCTYNEMKLS